MEKQFRITWEIDIFATTPEEAIAKAMLKMPHPLNPDSIANFFQTIEIANGKFVEGSAVEIDVEELTDEQRSLIADVLDGTHYED